MECVCVCAMVLWAHVLYFQSIERLFIKMNSPMYTIPKGNTHNPCIELQLEPYLSRFRPYLAFFYHVRFTFWRIWLTSWRVWLTSIEFVLFFIEFNSLPSNSTHFSRFSAIPAVFLPLQPALDTIRDRLLAVIRTEWTFHFAFNGMYFHATHPLHGSMPCEYCLFRAATHIPFQYTIERLSSRTSFLLLDRNFRHHQFGSKSWSLLLNLFFVFYSTNREVICASECDGLKNIFYCAPK